MTHNLCISQLRKSVSISAQLREGLHVAIPIRIFWSIAIQN